MNRGTSATNKPPFPTIMVALEDSFKPLPTHLPDSYQYPHDLATIQSNTVAFITGCGQRDQFLGERRCIVCGLSVALQTCHIIGQADKEKKLVSFYSPEPLLYSYINFSGQASSKIAGSPGPPKGESMNHETDSPCVHYITSSLKITISSSAMFLK
jgi:hypothetical protein